MLPFMVLRTLRMQGVTQVRPTSGTDDACWRRLQAFGVDRGLTHLHGDRALQFAAELPCRRHRDASLQGVARGLRCEIAVALQNKLASSVSPCDESQRNALAPSGSERIGWYLSLTRPCATRVLHFLPRSSRCTRFFTVTSTLSPSMSLSEPSSCVLQ